MWGNPHFKRLPQFRSLASLYILSSRSAFVTQIIITSMPMFIMVSLWRREWMVSFSVDMALSSLKGQKVSCYFRLLSFFCDVILLSNSSLKSRPRLLLSPACNGITAINFWKNVFNIHALPRHLNSWGNNFWLQTRLRFLWNRVFRTLSVRGLRHIRFRHWRWQAGNRVTK